MTDKPSGRDGPAIKLDPEFLEMLVEISVLESISLAEMVDRIDRMRGKNSRASGTRVFVLKYFEAKAMEAAAHEPGQRVSPVDADHHVVFS